MIYYHILPGSPDQHLYIGKIAELRDSITNLALPQFGYNYFRGSAIMTLYPYLNLLPSVFLSFLIKSKILLIYFTFGFYIFITLLISFYSSVKLSKSWQISYLFAIIYSISLMYINYTFANADVSESASLTWLPLIIFGFIKLIKCNTQWVELSIGLSLMIGTHVLNSIIIIALLVIWLLININKINLKIIINIIKAALLSISITAIIWIPAISFIISNPSFTRPVQAKIWKNVLPISFLVKASYAGRAYNGIDIFAIVEIILGLMYYRNFNRYKKQMYTISIIIMLFCSKFFPWHLMPFGFVKLFDQFQFTNRFYIIPQIMLNYLFADTVMWLAHKKKTRNYLLIIISLLTIGLQLKQQQRIMYFYNSSAEPFTKEYINNNKSSNYKNISYGFSPKHAPTHLNMEGAYKIDNNEEYNNVINPNNDFISMDYWPGNTKKLSFMVIGNKFLIKKSPNIHINKSNSINYMDNVYKSSPLYIIHHRGFNEFSFYNSKKSEIALPIFHYNKEKIKFYDNHRLTNINRHSNLIMFRAQKGNNIIKIRPRPSYNYEIGEKLTIIGFIGLIGYLFSMFILKLGIDRRKLIKGDKYGK